MANEKIELSHINWNEVFSFPHIFKSFKMAIHPSKLLLALAVILLIYAGGQLLDGVWGLSDQYVHEREIANHLEMPAGTFAAEKQRWTDARPDAVADLWIDTIRQGHSLSKYTMRLSSLGGGGGHFSRALTDRLTKENAEKSFQEPDRDRFLAEAKGDWSKALGKVEDEFSREARRVKKLLKASYKDAKNDVDSDGTLTTDEQKDRARNLLDKQADIASQALTKRKVDFNSDVEKIRGRAIFASLLAYERGCLSNVISAVLRWNITGGVSAYQNIVRGKIVRPAVMPSVPQVRSVPWQAPTQADDTPGFIYWSLMAGHGVKWLIYEHWLYAAIFLVLCLSAWALFGGAIHRIAALHAAREEKISMVQALKFSAGKFFSFFTAPLIPLGIIFALGALLMLGGLALGNWPYIGAVIMGVLFFLAILAGVVIAFILIGLVTGAGLMYPTIAVEGSDSFDAISRSFSYVFAKPWRAGFYAIIALFYGAICYLFVRLFAFLALAGTHFFVKWGVFTGGQSLAADADKLDVLWSPPTFDCLHGPFNWAAMDGWEKLGAFFIGLWVYLVVGLLAAFLLSYLASSTTVIYYLLRRRVDATDLDDVYVEEAAEQENPAEQPELGSEEPSTQKENPTEEETSTDKDD